MYSVGRKIDQFDVPVCNSFQAEHFNDQLCYVVDLNKLSNKRNIAKELVLGFYFLMDYNEDRQLTFGTNIHGQNFDLSMATNILKSHKNQNAFMYLDTIG